MGRSLLDHLAIAGVYIAGVVEAEQAALSSAPKVAKAYPVLKLEGVWNFVPLAFIALATMLWAIDILLRMTRPSYARARTTSPDAGAISSPQRVKIKIPWRPIGGAIASLSIIGAAILGIAGMVRCTDANNVQQAKALADKPEMKFAPVLRGSVTLAFVRQTLTTQDAVTSEKTLSSFLGTPMRVSGIVHENEGGASYSRMVRLTDAKATPKVYLLFGDDQNQSVIHYSPGEHIAAACTVERLDASGIGLDGCVIIPNEAWTGKPAS